MTNISLIEPVGGHGGMNFYDSQLSLALNNIGFNVMWFTCDETTENDSYIYKYFDGVYNKKLGKINRLFKFTKGSFKTTYKSLKEKVSVAHIHIFHFTILELILILPLKLVNIKVVATIHDVESFSSNDKQTIKSLIIFLIDRYIVHNRFSEQELLNNSKINKKLISVIPHGNHLDYIKKTSRDAAILDAGYAPDKFNILFFAQIKKVKGLDILLKALSFLSDHDKERISLRISGRPWKVTFDEYQSIIDDNNLEKIITKDIRYIPDDDVHSLFYGADLIVLPYRKIYQSGVLLLAMAYGTPVLVSDVPGMTETIIHGKNGVTFKNGNPEDLANQIHSILDGKFNLCELSANATRAIENNSWALVANKTADVYKS